MNHRKIGLYGGIAALPVLIVMGLAIYFSFGRGMWTSVVEQVVPPLGGLRIVYEMIVADNDRSALPQPAAEGSTGIADPVANDGGLPVALPAPRANAPTDFSSAEEPVDDPSF